jgi:hypothetical protein
MTKIIAMEDLLTEVKLGESMDLNSVLKLSAVPGACQPNLRLTAVF